MCKTKPSAVSCPIIIGLYFLLIGLFLFLSPCTGVAAVEQPSKKLITVVLDDNYPPYSFRDSQQKLQGIIIDEWRLWEQKTGVHAELHGMDWGDAKQRMAAGEFDVIDTIFKTPQRLATYDFSPSYAKLPVPIFFHHDMSGIVGIETLKGFPVAVKAGDAAIEQLTAAGIGPLFEYPSYEAIIKAAAQRKVNVFVIDRPPALYFLHKYNIAGEFRQTAPLSVGEFHRAVLKGNDATLALVNEGFARISPAEHQAIEERWAGTPAITGRVFRSILIIGVFALAAILFFIGWNYVLRRQVNARTLSLENEIKERKQIADSLYFSRFTLDHTQESIFWIDRDAHICDANETACQNLGYPLEEMKTLTVFDIDPIFPKEKWHEHWQRMVVGAQSSIETMHRRKNGQVFPVEISLCAFVYEGETWHCALARDITERKLAEQNLRNERARLHTLLQTIPDLIWLKDPEGTYLACNARFEQFFGAQEADIIGKTDYDFVDKELADFFREHDRKALAADQASVNQEWVTFADNGHRELLETIKTPMRDGDGNLIGVLGIARDITALKEAEAYQAFLLTTLNASLNEIYIFNADSLLFEFVSAGALQNLGYSLEEIKRMTPLDLKPDFTPESFAALTAPLRNGSQALVNFQTLHRRADGSVYPVDIHLQLVNQMNHPVFLAIILDITTLKEAEAHILKLNETLEQRVVERTALLEKVNGALAKEIKQRQQAQEEVELLNHHLQDRTVELELTNRELETFSYSVSHDLKAPLRHLTGFSRILLEEFADALPADGALYLHKIEKSGRKMAEMVDAILNLSQISKSTIVPQPVDLSALARELINELQEETSDRYVQVEIAEGLCATADPALIRVVLQNLLGNAWKYTRNSSPATIRFSIEEIDGTRYFCIRDNGAGFDMAFADKLFNAFQRLHGAEYEGTGIGLATVQRIIHRHGGEIKAEATPGKGAAFCFTLG